MPTLVMCRHGESDWNRQNRFTGWVDVDLSESGVAQATKSGKLLRETGLRFEVAFTSVLRRDGYTYKGPAFDVDGTIIWGFTAGILDALFDATGWAQPWDSAVERPVVV